MERHQCERSQYGNGPRCDREAFQGCPYCYACARFTGDLLWSSNQEGRARAWKWIQRDAKRLNTTPRALIEALGVVKKKPTCVWCGSGKKDLGVGGRFCSNNHAIKFAVSFAQTKEWDSETETWTNTEETNAFRSIKPGGTEEVAGAVPAPGTLPADAHCDHRADEVGVSSLPPVGDP